MKKRIAALTLALAMGGMMLAACGGGSSSTTAAPATTAAAAEAPKEETKAEEKPAETTAAAEASASTWKPDGPVTVICPYGAGGGQDIAARIYAQYMEKYAGVKFVVDNQTGGSGTIGNTAIMNSEPDGYTLGMFHNLSLYDQFVVDGVVYNQDSFIPIGAFTSDSTVIVVNKNLGVSSITELVELAKEKPEEITWGGPEFSSQTYPRMNIENATGVKFGKMIFDGGAKSLAAVAGGNCDVTSVFPSEYAAMADNPDVVAIATCGKERMPAFPDLPTMVEEGVDASFFQIRYFVLPAGADEEVVKFYSDLCKQVNADEDLRKELADSGFDFVDEGGNEECVAYVMDVFNREKDSIVAAVEASKQ